MDLRQYFQKIRQVEGSIAEKYPLVTSLETEDGGKAGVVSEVPRYEAARTIVEGKARLATDEEKQAFQERLAAGLKAAEELEAAKRLQFGLLFGPDRPGTSKPKSSNK
ncbi:MAG: hypothetical protein WB676_33550 [Bryobacteraceae bacterium]